MKKLAFLALSFSATLFACGGGDDSGSKTDGSVVVVPDGGGTTTDSMVATGACNPVSQTGCEAGEKCQAILVDNGFDEKTMMETDTQKFATGCVPEGTVALGAECAYQGEGETEGFDNCVKGAQCIGGICEEICQSTDGGESPDTCATENTTCSFFTGILDDLGPDVNAGVCEPTCDPLAQDCPGEGDGCYLNIISGRGVCGGASATEKKQGDSCAAEDGNCYLNSCSPGQISWIPSPDVNEPSICATFCSPVDTYQGIEGGGNAVGADPLSCKLGRIGVGHHGCRFLQAHYSNTDKVPATIGVCEDEQLWGSCELCNLPHLITLSDADFQEYCMANEEECQCRACVSDATLDALLAEVPPTLRASRFDRIQNPKSSQALKELKLKAASNK